MAAKKEKEVTIATLAITNCIDEDVVMAQVAESQQSNADRHNLIDQLIIKTDIFNLIQV